MRKSDHTGAAACRKRPKAKRAPVSRKRRQSCRRPAAAQRPVAVPDNSSYYTAQQEQDIQTGYETMPAHHAHAPATDQQPSYWGSFWGEQSAAGSNEWPAAETTE